MKSNNGKTSSIYSSNNCVKSTTKFLLIFLLLFGCQEDIIPPFPIINGVNPTEGSPGDEIIISGANFDKITSVTFGLKSARYNASSTSITAIVPDDIGYGAVPLTIVTKNGAMGFNFTVKIQAPVITKISPNEGVYGDTILVTGNYLDGVTSVTFGEIEALFAFEENHLIVLVPENISRGPMKITVVTPGGSANEIFNKANRAPEIIDINPKEGRIGDSVIITGIDFIEVTSVAFGAEEVFFQSTDTAIYTVVPEHMVEGKSVITITNFDGTSTAEFNVLHDVASITAINPNQGIVGDNITITGTHLENVLSVLFGNASASFSSTSTRVITIVPNNVPEGELIITIITQHDTLEGNFTIIPDYPLITGESNNKGTFGDEIIISGTNLSSTISVLFDSTEASFTATNTSIITQVPQGVDEGGTTVTIVTHGGSVGRSFTVLPLGLPVIESYAPKAGPSGSKVTIRGKHVAFATVKLGDIKASIFSQSQEEIVFEVPSGVPGSISRITVTNGLGNRSTEDNFYVGKVLLISDFEGGGIVSDNNNWNPYGDIGTADSSYFGFATQNAETFLFAQRDVRNQNYGYGGVNMHHLDQNGTGIGFGLTKPSDKVVMMMDLSKGDIRENVYIDFGVSFESNNVNSSFSHSTYIYWDGFKTVAGLLSDFLKGSAGYYGDYQNTNQNIGNSTGELTWISIAPKYYYFYKGYYNWDIKFFVDNVQFVELE